MEAAAPAPYECKLVSMDDVPSDTRRGGDLRTVLSPKTVRNNVSNIFSKLQVADRAQAIVRARAAGLASDRP